MAGVLLRRKGGQCVSLVKSHRDPHYYFYSLLLIRPNCTAHPFWRLYSIKLQAFRPFENTAEVGVRGASWVHEPLDMTLV